MLKEIPMKTFALPRNQTLVKQPHASPLKAIVAGLIASAFVFGSMDAPNPEAKSVRKALTEAQKADLRKKGREWCMKNYIRGGAFIVRIEIMSDGRVRCWFKS